MEEKIAQVTGAWDQAKLFLDDNKAFLPDKAKELFPHGIGQVGRIFEELDARKMVEGYNDVQRFFVENTRLGIPVLFHEECLHGAMEYDAVSYAHPIAMAGSFNPQLVQQAYAFTAKDARSRGARQALTPVLDVARDPRWGRVEETFGEDPYLVSEMGLSAVRGLQGTEKDALADDKLIASLKHFAAHGQPEDGTNCAPANYSERIIREVFLYPFKRAIMEGGALSVMASYNEIDGIPSHASRWLLQDILRKEFGFRGTVISDYYGIEQLEERHHVAETKAETAEKAFSAGVDIELPEPNIYPALAQLVKDGRVSEQLLDEAVYRLLYYKFYCGLFDDPYADPDKAESVATDKNASALSYDLGCECITLLKNENDILPIKERQYKKIAVVGPNADHNLIGGYACPNKNFVTILKGISGRLTDACELVYAKGCGITTEEGSWFVDDVFRTDEADDRQLIKEAVAIAQDADLIILCIGGNEQTSREAWKETHLGDRPDLKLVGLQQELFDQLYALEKPIVTVLSHGRPLAITDISEKSDALLDCWYLGQETGYIVADTILGNNNPSGKLPISYPRSPGHLPVFYNHKPNARRGYLFDNIAPLFPFGFGLSYARFSLHAVRLSKTTIAKGEGFVVNLTVANDSDRDGAEVVQIYVRDIVSSVTRPVKELKALKKVWVKARETVDVSVPVLYEALMFYDVSMNYIAEPGEFAVMVGTSSRDEDLSVLKLVLEE